MKINEMTKQKEPFDDTTKTFYNALFKSWGLDVETECEIFSRSRCIDLVVQCRESQRTMLESTIFSHFRQLNAIELKGGADSLTVKDYNRIMMRVWGLGAVNFKLAAEPISRLPEDRTLTILCVNRPRKILDVKRNLFGFKATEQAGIYQSAGPLNKWLIYPSELALIEKNYPLLVLAKGEKLEQFIDLCLKKEMVDYLDLTLRIGSLNDPYVVWKELLKVKQMNTIRDETWLLIDQFFKDIPEGFSKVKTLQENLMDKWDEGRKEGLEKGLEKGLEAGELKNARHSLLRLLSKKFANVPDDIVQCVEKTNDLASLQDWFDQAIMATEIERVEFAILR